MRIFEIIVLFLYVNYFITLSSLFLILLFISSNTTSSSLLLNAFKQTTIGFLTLIIISKILILSFIYKTYLTIYLNFYLVTTSQTILYFFPFIFIFILITGIAILFCLNYNYSEVNIFLTFCYFILFCGFNLLWTNSLLLFFFYYECLLLPSFFILYVFSKTRRSVEAAYLMFFWTQFGAIWLIFGFIYVFVITGSLNFNLISGFSFSKFDTYFIFACLLFGFGVKLPIWPFYEWLPKAHVEASTNFSIFLSGVLVKFAFLGFFKCLFFLKLDLDFFLIFPYLLVGIVDSVFKMFYQIDIKKLIAYSTVVEMHWLLICILSGQNILLLSAVAMLISHAVISTNSFLIVDSLTRRFKTRLITELSGLNYLCPKLFIITFINLLIFLGFPGSLFFISEFLFFSFIFDTFPVFAFVLLFLIYFLLSIFFFKIWLNILFCSFNPQFKNLILDLDRIELMVFLVNIIILFWLGSSWLSFLF